MDSQNMVVIMETQIDVMYRKCVVMSTKFDAFDRQVNFIVLNTEYNRNMHNAIKQTLQSLNRVMVQWVTLLRIFFDNLSQLL